MEAAKSEAEEAVNSEKEEDISGTKTPVKKVLKKKGGKKKRSVSASGAKSPVKPRDKWYTEFVDFHTKKQVIEEFLQDNSRQSYEIKLHPQAILGFKILEIFSVEN